MTQGGVDLEYKGFKDITKFSKKTRGEKEGRILKQGDIK